MQGIKIKQYINTGDNNEVIVTNTDITLNTYTDEEYKKILNDLISEGTVQPVTMEDNEWVIVDEFLEQSRLNFPFILQPNINELIKKYVLIKLGVQYRSSSTIVHSRKEIVDFLKETNFLNLNRVVNLRDEIAHWSDTRKRSIHILQEFIRFSNLDSKREYYTVLNGVSIPDSNTRTLPSYQSIITFDYIIQDFIVNSDDKIKMRYYPILIWWELTKIIPLRPIELYLLEREWVYEQNGKYYIHLVRRKKKHGDLRYTRIAPLNEIEISYELYNLLSYYIKEANKFNNSKYILNYEFMNSFRDFNTNNKRNQDFCGGGSFRKLLLKFYKEVVTEQYGYTVIPKQDEDIELKFNEIEVLNVGDTRHIAICSMMLQGFNELTIAQLAGHARVSEQVTYSNHLESYTKAYTYVMAKSFKNRINLVNKDVNSIRHSREMIMRKALLGNDYDGLRKTDYGRCKSKNFPFECDVEDCLFCDHFIRGSELTQKVLDEKLKIVDKEIATKLSYIKSVVQTERKYGDNRELKTNTNSLHSLLVRRAIIEAYKMGSEESQ
ncbi:hypothetical protein J0J70_00100 [Turicibacter bilis]|uniref:Integrase n=1 Tax=Turicibacter bilis TaxID=2735723 RepID=A0A9Q9CH83_9FIRM|nr:hypothetical protein [Turicibacter bilis]MBS3198950.1 hypothetical protein [Turicibacter bilis]UUF08493.1 hypothetical protein J0J70_00100 [Turicibacter bilis]